MTRPRALAHTLAVALAALTLNGCLERKQTGMINPDGTGKAVIDTLVAAPPVPAGQPPMDPAIMGKQLAMQVLTRAQGVDAWKDVTIDTAPDGRIHVAATAYFSDVSKFKIDAPFTNSWTKDAQGNYSLVLTKDNPTSQPAPPNLTDDQIKQMITQAKADYKQNQPVMQTTLSGLKIDTIYTLPGAVDKVNIFTKGPDNTVALHIDGKQILAAMDKIMNDDALLTRAIKAGNNTPEADNLLIENIFGQKGPISATTTGPVKELFDFKAESAAAKAGQDEMFKKLGIDPTHPPAMPGMPPQAPTPQP